MSRELKFRIWDDFNKEWLGKSDNDSLVFYGFHLAGEVMSVQCPPQWALDPCCTVEQYTGLKDKNGKDIYEGDIIKQAVYVIDGKERTTTWQVRWNKGECCFELHYLRGRLFGDSLMSDDEEYEVIGNIHEPPKDFRAEHLKRMGVTMIKGGEE